MAPHLRPVPSAPEGQVFVVARSRHVRAGAPYVLAACVDESVAMILTLGEHEVHGRSGMEGDLALAEALAAWEAGDHGLFHAEENAKRTFRAPAASSRLLHPSRLGKLGTR